MKTEKINETEEQDKIWEEFYQEARECVEWVDFTLDREAFFYLKEEFIIIRKNNNNDRSENGLRNGIF